MHVNIMTINDLYNFCVGFVSHYMIGGGCSRSMGVTFAITKYSIELQANICNAKYMG